MKYCRKAYVRLFIFKISNRSTSIQTVTKQVTEMKDSRCSLNGKCSPDTILLKAVLCLIILYFSDGVLKQRMYFGRKRIHLYFLLLKDILVCVLCYYR